MTYLYQKVESADFKQTDTRESIKKFILQNRDNIGEYSMDEIARLTYTSKSTLVRFGKYFKYSGWKDFVYDFTHEIAHIDATNDVNANLPFDNLSDTLEIMEKVGNLKLQALKETVSLQSSSSITKAAEILDKSDTIIIFGRSPNSYNGELFKRNLNSIQKKAFVADTDEAGILAKILTSKDCAIFISYSGNNVKEFPMKHVPILLDNQVPIISITGGGGEYLRKFSAVALNIVSKEKLYSKISNFSTEESIHYLLDVLYAKLFSLDYDTNIKMKIETSKLLEEKRLTDFKDISE
ncbi:MurR/RpiR family transcriptional regulator [Lactococcus petauri]|uniref:MurR/RpiR family transcriptional regulator n=1 Tax=Lactococcus petauri TaxID=1940789 RepID=UPI0022DEA440|nr:MurR/RpiR family transcriptional regulator [Lactococcus petauri]